MCSAAVSREARGEDPFEVDAVTDALPFCGRERRPLIGCALLMYMQQLVS
jgi:hypothetical protein